MCGIFGWASKSPVPHVDSIIEPALDAISHRGPDGQAHVELSTSRGAQIVLGHRRLSIIDIAGGSQPMWSHDERYVITFNGEIYNYIELKAELISKGHRIASSSDTEVVLEAFRRWGADALHRFRGMFAFVIYDKVDDCLFIARDHFGKKPLYLTDLPDGIAFSSEIEPFFSLPSFRRELEEGVVGEYLLSRFVDGPGTFFRGVRKLLPGHYAVWRNGELTEERYYEPPFASVAPEHMIKDEEAAEAFRSVLDDSVRIRMRSDAPFGAYLSGGLDSSVVVALMMRHSAGPVNTFSVGFSDARYSEAHYARQVAESLGTRHHELVVDPGDFAGAWENAVLRRGAPVSEASDIPILLLSREAGRQVKMVLTGEGADELLGGYPKYRAEQWVGAYQRLLPPALHKRMVHPLIGRLPSRFDRIKILSRAVGEGDVGLRQQTWFASSSLSEVRELLGETRCSLGSAAPKRVRDLGSPARRLQLQDQLHWLPDNLLERGDRMMMAGSVEGRMPFMDVELARLVAGLPQRLLTGGVQGKRILRTIAGDLLDHRIIYRKKVGFAVPLASWFRSELSPMIKDLLGPGSTIRNLLQAGPIDRLLQEHMSGKQDHRKPLWTLGNLELFIRAYRLG